MLVLRLKVGESYITHDADGKISTATLITAGKEYVQIGIEADDWVNIDREKIYKRKMRELEK